MALTHGIKPIVTNGLVLCLDAGNRKSYPGIGTAWTDLINSNTASLDTPTYSNGTLNFGGIYDIVSSNYNLTLGSSFSISLWLRHTNSSPVKETYIALGFDKIVVRVNDAGNLNLYVTDATEQNLFTWGFNNQGRTGNNGGNVPATTFAGGTNWKQVSQSNANGTAIKTDGTLWSWGVIVGDNTGTGKSIPVTTFAGGTNWKSVAAGYLYAAAIKTDGSLWTWGTGSSGQLGTNDATQRNTPVTTFAGGNNWKQVACGRDTMAAIKTDGSLWLWGSGVNGRLGTNNTTTRSTPVTTFAGGNNWKQVSCGREHTAAIKTDGTLWTWGANNPYGTSMGQLGTNDTTNRLTPVTTFAGGTTWKQVACGYLHTAAIKTDGTLWTWGNNDGGALGDNTATNRSTPVTTFAGGTTWKQVSCGNGNTAAIKTDGSLWTWGVGNSGSLGAAGASGRSTPITTFAGGTNWKQSSISDTTAAAIRTNETTTTDVSISTPILSTTYYNIVATSNGTTLKLYQNNSLLTTANLNGTLTSTTLFYTISDIMNSFAGNLANIQIHNKELTATEIAQNYNALKSRYI
jgi:alpha-tubulin suppressor-like RCC1 family protein